MYTAPRALFLAAVFALSSCSRPAPAVLGSAPSKPAAPPSNPPHFIHAAGSGEVAGLVREAREAAKARGETLLVYVGASWCEPCGHFHRAVEAGKLTNDIPNLALLEFDLDRDAKRLESAGYDAPMIPLFVVPDPDGRGTATRIAGSIHGAGAVQEILPRLKPLLTQAE